MEIPIVYVKEINFNLLLIYLPRVTQKLKKLVAHMKEKYPDDRENVQRLGKNFNPKK